MKEHHESLRTNDRKSHSGIPGSKAACAYPGLIAACHALLQLPSQAIHQIALRVQVYYETQYLDGVQYLCTAFIMSHSPLSPSPAEHESPWLHLPGSTYNYRPSASRNLRR